LLQPVIQFQEACAKTAESWQKFSFAVPNAKETPGQNFGRVGSSDALKEGYKMSQKMDAPWVHIVGGVAGVVVGVAAAVSGVGLVGLAGAAAFGGVSALTYSKAKKKDEQLKGDLELAVKLFPIMQKGLDQVLGRGVELGKGANQAFLQSEISDTQRREAIREIHKTIRDFSTNELGLDDGVLESKKAGIKSPLNSTEIIDQVSAALGELEELHDEPGTRSLKPIIESPGRGAGKVFDVELDNDLGGNDVIPPPAR